jgi:hypothetical protein
MKYLYSLLLIILFLNLSCNRTKTAQETSKNIDSLKISADRIVSTIAEILIPKAKKAVSEWKEYRDVDDFMLKYYSISTTEALDNAKELSDLVQLMRDTVRIEKLKGLNVTARFNVLHNEALRLADMATISSISNEEVKEAVFKIVEVYSAVNSKINTIYKAEELQNSLEIDTETPIETNEKLMISERKKLDKLKKPRKKLDKKLISPKKME